jgi:hypothetical protein
VNNLDESRLVTWVVHAARRFVERAKREARRRPLAAITQKSVGGSSSKITDAEKNSRDSGRGVLTTGFDGAVGGCIHSIGARRRVRRGEPRSCATPSMEGIEWGGGNRGRCREGRHPWGTSGLSHGAGKRPHAMGVFNPCCWRYKKKGALEHRASSSEQERALLGRQGCWPSRGIGASATSAMELLLEFLGACWFEEEEGGGGVHAQGKRVGEGHSLERGEAMNGARMGGGRRPAHRPGKEDPAAWVPSAMAFEGRKWRN